MAEISNIAKKLLQSGIESVVGFREDPIGGVRPMVARSEQEAEAMIYDDRCHHNLAVYLTRKESAGVGKVAVVATIPVVRSVVRLAAEKQFRDGEVVVIAVEGGEPKVLESFKQMEEYLQSVTPSLRPKDMELLEKLEAMSEGERWDFWKGEMESCIKCYACRQTCPLCYCTQCTTEINVPQWIPVEASTIGNLEWHVMRAMHLSGRCVGCGQCGDACPVGIPIHMLPIYATKLVMGNYGVITGMKVDEGTAMSTYKPDDKENFIG